MKQFNKQNEQNAKNKEHNISMEYTTMLEAWILYTQHSYLDYHKVTTYES